MWPFKPNDWKTVYIAEVNQYTRIDIVKGNIVKRTIEVTHILQYSESRNKYRMDFIESILTDK